MASLNQNMDIKASDLFGRVTVNVRVVGMRVATFRIKCGIALIWLATKVAGVGIHLDIENGG